MVILNFIGILSSSQNDNSKEGYKVARLKELNTRDPIEGIVNRIRPHIYVSTNVPECCLVLLFSYYCIY